MSKLGEIVKDREAWRAAVRGVSESGTHGETEQQQQLSPPSASPTSPSGLAPLAGSGRVGRLRCLAVPRWKAPGAGWLEYRITIPDELPEKHIKIAEIVKERYNLSVVKKTKRQIRKEKYGHKLFRLINETYCVLYGYSLLSEKQIDQYVDVYLGLVDMEMLTFIEDSEGELIGAGITIPSMAEALQKCNGEIFPFGWYHLLKSMYWGKPDTLDMLLIGVKPEWQNKGVNSLLFVDLFQRYKKMGFKYAETNANLETNAKVQAMWTPFEREQHKKRWVFGKEI